MAAIAKEIQTYPESEVRITILKAIPALISFDPAVVAGETPGYKKLIEGILNLL